MNEQDNAPMSPSSSGFSGWFSTWVNAVTTPSEQLYTAMTMHPGAASLHPALTWVFLAGTIAVIISGVLQAILQAAGVPSQMPDLSNLIESMPRGLAASLGISLLMSPLSGAIATLFFVIFIGIVQWMANVFKGTGTFSRLAYVTAAISVPFTFLAALLTPFGGIHNIGYFVSGINLLLALYSLYLQILAVKAVNQFGWGKAIGAYFLPLILLVLFCVCVAIGFGLIFGSVFSELFKQGLAP